ncbi:phosphotriesterase-related protein [Streptomyces sp. NPDC050636]|uniref:phosphotriesterase family protein n=1 Tax=Streptomyces sp. NPDC050636 TaxID=3154510 RepID=UPI0034359B00
MPDVPHDQVHSVRGPVAAADLGATLVHEHVFVLSPEMRNNLPHPPDAERLVDHAVSVLAEAGRAGVGSVVDGTIIGQGRDVALVERVAERTNVHLLVATGVYVHEELPGWFRHRAPRGADATDVLTEIFLRDIRTGVGATSVRAAMVKCTLDTPEPSPDGLRAIRAAAQAQRETGVPVISHCEARTATGLRLAKELTGLGVPPERILIGHSGDTDDLDYLERLLGEGVNLGMDRFGYDFLLPHAKRVGVVAELCRRGYADQLFLGHDAPCFIDWFQDEPGDRALPGGITTVHRRVVPELRELGVPDADVRRMLTGNPRRLFTPAVPTRPE